MYKNLCPLDFSFQDKTSTNNDLRNEKLMPILRNIYSVT